MGQKGIEMVGANLDNIVNLLEKAYADEWLAHYQYWVGAKIVKGPMKEAVIAELLQHAADELRHADMVTTRLIQLGASPLIHPSHWLEKTNCGYESPEDPFVRKILEQNINGERCAISVYRKLMEETKETDFITYNMVLQILQDEVEHEEDLQALAEDFDLMMQQNR